MLAETQKDPNWVPWTTQQTFYAVLLTLVPWIGFNLLLAATGSDAGLKKPLSFTDDLGGAVLEIFFTAVVEGIFLLAPYYCVKRTQIKQELQSRWRAFIEVMGLRRFNVVRTIPWIVGLMLLIIVVNVLYSYAITTLHLPISTNSEVVLQESKFAPLTVYAILIGSVLVAPICEEIFFRGFVLPGLLHDLSPLWAILVSSALFAIAHTDLSSFIPLFTIGLCLGFLRWRTGSTWASISLHMLNNLLSSIVIILAMHNINLPF
jgi:membrane protease YdiL (CAAX protease family)